MKMTPVLVNLPPPLTAQLKALRAQGYTVSGFIRAALVRALAELLGHNEILKRRAGF